MINKIDNLSSGVRSSASVRRIESRSVDAGAASKPEAAPAAVGIKTGKTLIERATDRAKSGPDVDAARVSEIKTAIANGEFSIDPKAVARAFINMESA